MDREVSAVRWKKWIWVTFLVAMLLALGVFSYRSVEHSQADFEELSRVDLPLFDDIQKLNKAQTTIESAVYEYYLTTDAEQFSKRFLRQKKIVDESFRELKSVLDEAPELKSLVEVQREIERNTETFNEVMSATPIDWDRAREVLSEFEPLIAKASKYGEMLGTWVGERVVERTQSYSQQMRSTVYLVAILTALTIIAAAYLAFVNYKMLNSVKEQRRQASFPRSNPHPVMSLDLHGNIVYANESAYLIGGEGGPEFLLPDDIEHYLTQSSDYQEWYFEKEGRYFRINLGWLEEHNEYHAYISDISARKKAEARLEYLAYHDPVTGLLNRQQFSDFVDRQLQNRDERSLYVAIIDIDLLSKVVAAGGIKVTENIARRAARRLKALVEEVSAEEGLSFFYWGRFV